jgi:hypothetical protein
MPILLVLPTENVIKSEKSEVGATQTAVGTALELKNNQGFAANEFLVIGREGSETAELRQIDSVNADQKNIVLKTATKFVHSQFEEVVKYSFNQRKIYRKLSGESAYSLIATVDIEVDRPLGTYYSDSTGADTALYKATYYNSYSLVESSIDDAKAVYGGGGDHYCLLDEIREEAGFNSNDNIEDGRIFRLRARAEGEVNASLIKSYALPLHTQTYWEDSSAAELIRQITVLLSAGWLLYQEYPDERESGTSKDGLLKIKEARSMLKDIREDKLILLGSDNNKLTLLSGIGITGYPNDSLGGIPDSNHDDDGNFVFGLGKGW